MATQVQPKSATRKTPAQQRAEQVQAYVDQQLEKTRKQVKTVDLVASCLFLVAFVLAFFLLIAIVDAWIYPLSVTGRVVALIALIAGTLWVGWTAIVPLILRKINPDYAARMIEESRPDGFKNSLLNYLSLRRQPDSAHRAVYNAVADQAATDLTSVKEEMSLDQSNLIRMGFILVGVATLFVAYLLLSPKSPVPTLSRVLFPTSKISRPAVVQIKDVQPGDARVFFGETLDVTAQISGEHSPQDVKLVYSTTDGKVVDAELPMAPQSTGGYQVALTTGESGIQQSLTYRIIARDGTSAEYAVTVRPNPTIAVETIKLVPPAYTEMPPRVLEGQGDIQCLEGTKVQVAAVANLPIKVAYVELLNQKSNQSMDPEADNYRVVQTIKLASNGSNAEGEFVATLNNKRTGPLFTHYRLKFVADDDSRSVRPNVYPIRITPDLAPEVRVVEPVANTVSVAENGKLQIDIEATDLDFEISSIDLHIDHRGTILFDRDLRLKAEQGNRRATSRYSFEPEKLNLKNGDVVVFYATASDNRTSPYGNAPDPNISRTENYTINIVEAVEKPEQSEQGDQGEDGSEAGDKSQGQDEKIDQRQEQDSENKEGDASEVEQNSENESGDNSTGQNQKDGSSGNESVNDSTNRDQTQEQQEQNSNSGTGSESSGQNSENSQNSNSQTGDGQEQQSSQDSATGSESSTSNEGENSAGDQAGDNKSDTAERQDGAGNQQAGSEQDNSTSPSESRGAGQGDNADGSSNNSTTGDPQDGSRRSSANGEETRDESLSEGEYSNWDDKHPGEKFEDLKRLLEEYEEEQKTSGQEERSPENQQQPENSTGQEPDAGQPGERSQEPGDSQAGREDKNQQPNTVDQQAGNEQRGSQEPGNSGNQQQDPNQSQGEPGNEQNQKGGGQKGTEGNEQQGQPGDPQNAGEQQPNEQSSAAESGSKSGSNQKTQGEEAKQNRGGGEPNDRSPQPGKAGDKNQGASNQADNKRDPNQNTDPNQDRANGNSQGDPKSQDQARTQEDQSQQPESNSQSQSSETNNGKPSSNGESGSNSNQQQSGTGQGDQKESSKNGSESGDGKGQNGLGEKGQGSQSQSRDDKQGSGQSTDPQQNESGSNGSGNQKSGGDQQSKDGQKSQQGDGSQQGDSSSKSENDGGQGKDDPQAGGGSNANDQKGDQGQSGQEKGNQGQGGDQKGQGGDQKDQKGGAGQGGGQQQGGDGQKSGGNNKQNGAAQKGSAGQAGQGQGQGSGESNSEQTNAGQGGSGSGGGTTQAMSPDEVNQEYAEEVVDLVLDKLKNQTKNPDPELLDKLKMSKEQLAEFVDRYEEMRKAAKTGDVQARRKYEEKLSSLGLRPSSGKVEKAKEKKDDQVGLTEEGAVNRTPSQIRDDFDSFLRERSRRRN